MTDRSRVKTASMAIACGGGNAAVEFALVLPVLMLILMGTFQIGLMMYSYNLMAASARDAARSMAVCLVTDPTIAKVNIYKTLPPWVPQSKWIIEPVFGDDVSVRIRVDASLASLLSYIPVNFGQLDTFVQMKKEPLATGGGSCGQAS